MNGFPGYDAPALPLLTAIGCADRTWFAEHRHAYAEHLLEPTRQLVTAIGSELGDAVPGLQAIPKVNGSIAPITNDVRFRELPPYRDHLVLRFWTADRGGPTMFLRISEQNVAFGGGMALDAPRRDRYRQAVAEAAGQNLAELVAGLERRHGAAFQGPAASRVPAPYPQDHPRAALLRRQRFQVQWAEPVPKAIGNSRFVPWCGRRLVELAGVHLWLQEHVAAPVPGSPSHSAAPSAAAPAGR
jgi:uncharacterized protein (TIGR02453 family)